MIDETLIPPHGSARSTLISPYLVSQRLSEQLQQQEGLPAVGAVVEQTEHQHLQEGGGATLRHQEDQLSQVQRLSLKQTQGSDQLLSVIHSCIYRWQRVESKGVREGSVDGFK